MALVGLASAVALFAGCAGTPPGAGRAPPPPSPASPSSTTEEEREPGAGEHRATTALGGDERREFGLPPVDEMVDAAALPPLAPGQWADPGAVAARLAMVQANYRASEEWSSVRARWLPYLVPRLAEDLAGSVAGGAVVADLRAREAVFVGDVLGLAVDERSEDRAVVSITIRRSVVTRAGPVQAPRVAYWVLTLVFDRVSGRWLVAEVER